MTGQLKQFELEDLSVWFDGELAKKRKDEVDRLVATDPAWKQEYERLILLDELLDSCSIPADRTAPMIAAEADLAERIIRNVRRTVRSRRLVIRLAAAAVPAAAIAAAILVAILLVERVVVGLPGPVPGAEVVAKALDSVPAEDRFVVENLEFFEDYDVLENYESLEAIDRLESKPTGT